MILSEKANAFMEYAKKKKWDCSLLIYDDKFMAILNPINKNHIYEGESKDSMDEAIDFCKIELQKNRKGKR